MRLFFALLILALSYAAISGAALAWDGSYYLFRMLDAQSPVFVQYRYSIIPLHFVVLLLSKITENFAHLRLAFSAVYVIIPLAALALSWWVLDRESKRLFVWPALGICLGTLPGQMFFVSESMIAVQLFWPVLLMQLRRIPERSVPALVVLSIVVFFTHPVSAILFGLSVVACLIAGMRSPEVKSKMWLCAISYALAAGLRLMMIRSSYEINELSTRVLRQHFEGGLSGVPLAFLGVAWLAGVGLLVGRFGRTDARGRSLTLWNGLALAAIVVAGLILVQWALDPSAWRQALNYRTFVFIGSFPFMVFAGIDVFASTTDGSASATPVGGRRLAVYFAGAVYALMIVIQSTLWSALVSRVAQELSVGKKTQAVASLAWTRQTPLYHWSTPALGVVLQGKAVHSLLLDDKNSLWLTSFDGEFNELFGFRRSRSHWFHFPSIGHLTTTVEYVASSGWYQPETRDGEKTCWNNGRGSLRIEVDTAVDAMLHARVGTSIAPNELSISVNGRLCRKLPITCAPWEYCDIIPVCLPLKEGENLVEFGSTYPGIPAGEGNHELGLAFRSLHLRFAFGDTLDIYP